jgi:anti-anti-sigma factor
MHSVSHNRRRPPAAATALLQLQVHQPPSDETVVVSIRGDLDRTTAPALATCLDDLIDSAATPAALTVDLSRLTFIDVGGLNVLVAAAQSAGRCGRTLRLSGCTRFVLRVIRIIDVTDVFEAIQEREQGDDRLSHCPAPPIPTCRVAVPARPTL